MLGESTPNKKILLSSLACLDNTRPSNSMIPSFLATSQLYYFCFFGFKVLIAFFPVFFNSSLLFWTCWWYCLWNEFYQPIAASDQIQTWHLLCPDFWRPIQKSRNNLIDNFFICNLSLRLEIFQDSRHCSNTLYKSVFLWSCITLWATRTNISIT